MVWQQVVLDHHCNDSGHIEKMASLVYSRLVFFDNTHTIHICMEAMNGTICMHGSSYNAASLTG